MSEVLHIAYVRFFVCLIHAGIDRGNQPMFLSPLLDSQPFGFFTEFGETEQFQIIEAGIRPDDEYFRIPCVRFPW